MVNVLIVEDQRMMRETMENYIMQTEGYHLSGSIAAAGLAENYCARNQVDLVLMDVCTEHDESGFESTKILKARFPKEVGADSIWFKDVSREELVSIVERTMNGESVYPDRMPTVRIGNATNHDFTEAETKVLHLLVEGMTYKQMADELQVSTDCIKAHISNMLSKTGFTSKTKLAAMVMSKRLVVNGF